MSGLFPAFEDGTAGRGQGVLVAAGQFLRLAVGGDERRVGGFGL
jgi:hypothetical protein